MNFRPATPKLPLAGWPLIALCGLYLLAGLLDHDPWKVDDAVNLGVAFEFARGGEWLTPRIGLDPWFGAPPLFHWVAAVFGKSLDAILPFHAAARLATTLFGAAMLIALSRAARTLAADGNTHAVPLLAIGTLGLLLPIHDAQPMIALLAAQATLYWGLAQIPSRPAHGGMLMALALGGGLLSAGTLGALYLLPLPLLLLLHHHWRTPRTVTAVLLALTAGLTLGSLWPLLLTWQSPQHLELLLKAENTRFSLQPFRAAALTDHFKLLGWATWPLLPLASWAIWAERKRLGNPSVFLPLLAGLSSTAAIFAFAEPRPLQHLPLIPPLCLLAAQGVERLRRGAANAFDWFGVMTFTLVAGLVWLGGVAMMTGEPARIAKNFTKAEPGFVGEWSWTALAIAAALTGLWFWSLIRSSKSPWRSASHWAAGITLIWALLAALWMPWMNYGKTYRPMAASLKRALGDSNACVASRNLGDAQKASFRYFTDLAPQRGGNCPWLLVQGNARNEKAPAGWQKVWESNRPGDRNEKFWLYRRG
ncbi:MAG: hypothetical protein M0P39_09840 [Rhodocyclaceae bacterium]|nr:hypothetical protein [Rhodocyclaceae bacterium]